MREEPIVTSKILKNSYTYYERYMMFEEPIATSEKYIINLNHIYHRITRSFMSWFLKFAHDHHNLFRTLALVRYRWLYFLVANGLCYITTSLCGLLLWSGLVYIGPL